MTGMEKRLPEPGRVPEDLRLLRRWVVWGLEERGGKPAKVPYVPGEGRRRASVRDPSTWGFFGEAHAAAREAPWALGVGLVLGEGLVGVDLDGALEGGEPLPFAREVLEATPTYAEVSPSGRGLHLLVYGRSLLLEEGAGGGLRLGAVLHLHGEALPGRERCPSTTGSSCDWLERRFRRGGASPPLPSGAARPRGEDR